MAFLIYNHQGYTVPKQLLDKYSLESGSVVNDFSIINDKEFYDSFVEEIDYFKWHIRFIDREGRTFSTERKAITQDEAKAILEYEKEDITVNLVCDFWDNRKKRKVY